MTDPMTREEKETAVRALAKPMLDAIIRDGILDEEDALLFAVIDLISNNALVADLVAARMPFWPTVEMAAPVSPEEVAAYREKLDAWKNARTFKDTEVVIRFEGGPGSGKSTILEFVVVPALQYAGFLVEPKLPEDEHAITVVIPQGLASEARAAREAVIDANAANVLHEEERVKDMHRRMELEADKIMSAKK